MTFLIKKRELLPVAIRRIAAEQLKIAAIDSSRRTVPAAAIHNARKALKRVRAVLQLLRCGNHRKQVKHEDRLLRDAARILGAPRDLHVQRNAVKSLLICRDDDVCEVLRAHLRKLQSAQKPHLTRDAKHFANAIRSAEDRLAHWPISDFDKKQFAAALKDTYRRARKCFKQLRDVATGEKLHKWRKETKTLWHQLQLLDGTATHKTKRLTKRIHRLTQHLGDDHDLFMLQQSLTRVETVPYPLRRELRKRRDKLQKRAFKLARETFRLAPAAFHKQISRSINQPKI
jgi:CHAD domain-containing protein